MAESIRVLAWNIGGLSDAEHPNLVPALADAIRFRNPDIVFINEALRVGTTPHNNQVLELSSRTGLFNAAFADTAQLGLSNVYKLVGVLSKFPLSNPIELPPICDPWPGGGCYRTLEVQTYINGRTHFLYSTRWSAHIPPNNARMAWQLRDRIIGILAGDQRVGVIVGGDLNQRSMADNSRPPEFPQPLRDLVSAAGLSDVFNGDLNQAPVLGADGEIFNDYILYRGNYVASAATEGPMSGPGMNSGTDHYYVFADLLPYDAYCVGQDIPTTATIGRSISVRATYRNSGGVAWESTQRVRLAILPPTGWDTEFVELPGRVEPGHDVTFNCDLRPSRTGQEVLRTQMTKQIGGDFGTASPPAQITVSRPAIEPARCRTLRRQIGQMDVQIETLRDSLSGDSRADARIKAQILKLNELRARLVQTAQGIGCTV
jgi:hypothetical protein